MFIVYRVIVTAQASLLLRKWFGARPFVMHEVVKSCSQSKTRPMISRLESARFLDDLPAWRAASKPKVPNLTFRYGVLIGKVVPHAWYLPCKERSAMQYQDYPACARSLWMTK